MQAFNLLRILPKFFLLQLFWATVSFVCYPQNFSKGRWFKVYIPTDGLQRIDGNWFQKNNIPLNSIQTEKIAIYSEINSNQKNGISPLNQTNLRPLKKTPIVATGLEDKIFNPDDKLFFPIKSFESIYSDSTFCFIQLDEESSQWAIPEKSAPNGNLTNFAYQKLTWHEEKYNFLQSGQLWISEPFYKGEFKKINFPLKDLVPNERIVFEADLYTSSIYSSQISISNNLGNLTPTFEPISGDRYDKKAQNQTITQTGTVNESISNFETTFQFDSKAGSGNLGKITLWFPKKFTGIDNNTWYEIHNFKSNLHLENHNNSTQVWSLQKDGLHFYDFPDADLQIRGDSTSLVLVANSENSFEPILINKLESFTNDLAKDTELLILCPKEFEKAAKNLATYKIEKNIKTEIRFPESIYAEFSAGKVDINAIRKYIFDQKKTKQTQLKYLLLFTDASVDVKEKNVLSKNDLSISKIPSFESTESIYPLNSYVSDDFYGILSDTLATCDQDYALPLPIEISIGRIPAKSIAEAEMLVNKLIDAQNHRNKNLTFVADDEDANLHIIDSENFAKKLSDKLPEIPIQKLYLDAFPIKLSNGTYTSTEANKQLIEQFNKNAGFIHFLGHGSESGWTDEKIFTINDIVTLKNKNNLPILFTATCQFAKFDNPYILSGAEALLCSETGGAQAIIGTSRPVFQSNNFTFGNNIYELAILHASEKKFLIGDLVREAKNAGKGQIGNRNIILLGDPTSPLSWGFQKISIDPSDFLLGQTNEIIVNNPFSIEIPGNINVSLSNITQQTLGTKSPKFNFKQTGNTIFENEIVLKSGINKIKIPAFSLKNPESNEISIRFSGNKTNLENYLGVRNFMVGTGIPIKADKEGPTIEQADYLDNLFTISDSTGLGRILASNQRAYLTINDSLQIPIETFLNDFSQLNKWVIEIDESFLSVGENKVTFQICDLLQNETKKEFNIHVEMAKESPFKVFPNPFKDQFFIQLNIGNSWTKYPYKLFLYDLSGSLMEEINGDLLENKSLIQPKNLIPNKIYFYKIEILDTINRLVKRYFGKIIPTN